MSVVDDTPDAASTAARDMGHVHPRMASPEARRP
jgi:hypothetical protein